MNRITKGTLLALVVAGLGAACNPTVDPDATFTTSGEVVDADGQALANAEVRLIKYSSDLNLFAPTVETLFADTPSDDDEIGLKVMVVRTVRTDMSGRFEMSFTGSEIAAENGITTGDGRVEVATTVVVVRDPSDTKGNAGVYTYPYLFQDAARTWTTGKLGMWKAEATADVSNVRTTGLVDFTWKKLDRVRTSDVKNVYRLDIYGDSSARLIIRCSEGDIEEGGCETASDETKLIRSVSAYSIYRYYSDAGAFHAYVQASGLDFRYVSRFTLASPLPDLGDDRTEIGLEGVWAVGAGADQPLLGTAAVDGDPMTRVAITNEATSIYVKLPMSVITDAGILNTLIRNAAQGCVILEFSVNVFSDLDAAKRAESLAWTRHGKFCGETGGKGEVSAIVGFSTTDQDGVSAAWMRLRAEADAGSGAALVQFQQVGEIAVYEKSGM
ncbi:hypothetical protein L6R52_19635 [Myxococcota bacterium]|nr:hypothetical protein [Myxococcota bacterium]